MQFQLKEVDGTISREGEAPRMTADHTLLVWGGEFYFRHATESGDVAVYYRHPASDVIDLDREEAFIEATTEAEVPETGNVVLDRAHAQTSPAVSSKAAALMGMDDDEMRVAAIDPMTLPVRGAVFDGDDIRLLPEFCANVRSVAATAVRQDGTKGQ